MTDLRVFVPTPLPEQLCELIERLEPRLELVRDQSLLPPQRYPGDHGRDPSFRRTPAQQERFEHLIDSAEALYGTPDQQPSQLRRAVDANKGLRWVHTTPAGGGGQVKAAGLTTEQLARVQFTTSAGVHAGPLAEFALLGILAGAKRLPVLQADQRHHVWGAYVPVPQVSRQTIVVVGLGGIGRMVAAKCSALGATVVGVHRREVDAQVSRILSMDHLGDALALADAVVLCLPSTDQTYHVVGREALSRLRPGATLVNVGRGNTIDEAAMIEALEDGRIGFAALDVFEHEPLDPASPLWELPNVLVSPHGAAVNLDEERQIAELFAANATRLIDGVPLLNRVDTVEFY